MLKMQINLKTVRRNIKAMRAKLNPGVRFCAVLKANAYSLGDVTIARAIHDDVDWFAVAKLCEGVALREAAHVKKPILLFGVCDDIKTAIKHKITVSVNSLEEMQRVCDIARETGKIHVHIKVNTGLNRFGITTPWQLRTMLTLANQSPEVIVGGLYTHMSHETDNISEVDRQLKRFVPFRAIMRRYNPCAIIHAACTGAAEYQCAQFDMVRIGKAKACCRNIIYTF